MRKVAEFPRLKYACVGRTLVQTQKSPQKKKKKPHQGWIEVAARGIARLLDALPSAPLRNEGGSKIGALRITYTIFGGVP